MDSNRRVLESCLGNSGLDDGSAVLARVTERYCRTVIDVCAAHAQLPGAGTKWFEPLTAMRLGTDSDGRMTRSASSAAHSLHGWVPGAILYSDLPGLWHPMARISSTARFPGRR